jgi:hypothetical protein
MFTIGIGKQIPPGVKLIPLIAAAALWAAIFIHQATGKTGFTGVIFLIIFYVLTVFAVPTGGFLIISAIFDRESNAPAVTLGSGDKKIFIIYHPGASSFTADTLKKLGGSLSSSGFTTVLYPANKKTNPDLKDALAVGFSSPIYGGSIRPPVKDFIERSDLKDVKCFILLTAGGSDLKYLDSINSLIKKKGALIIAGDVLGQAGPRDLNERKIRKMASEIEEGLKQ